jgi:hypothetical protein
MQLSILIPSTPDRHKDLSKLLDCINEQEYTRKVEVFDLDGLTCWRYWDLLCPIEILVFEDEKIMTIGEKRDLLYKHAKGIYSFQIDSDDLIALNAIKLILEAIKQNPDCITFEEYVNIDGKEFKSNHSLEYFEWDGDGQAMFPDGFHYHRTPFFKSVIKTSIAQSVPVPRKRWGEDHEWARLLKPHLKTEIHIPEQIYKYIHVSSNHVERYGLDKD